MEHKVSKIDQRMSGDPSENFDKGAGRLEGPLSMDTSEGVLRVTPDDEEFTRQVESFVQTEGHHRRSYHKLAK